MLIPGGVRGYHDDHRRPERLLALALQSLGAQRRVRPVQVGGEHVAEGRAAGRRSPQSPGRSLPWSGARTALANISSRAAAVGAGSVSARADWRCSSEVYGLHAGIVADSPVLAYSDAWNATRTPSSRSCTASLH